MMSMILSDIAILNIKGSDYYCIISLIRKNEAINLMQNVDLTKKSGIIVIWKSSKDILTFGDIEFEKQ